MSTALSALLPERRRSEHAERHLRALERPTRRRRPKLAYALTAVIGAAVIGALQLGFSIATTQTTFEIRSLTEEQRSLTVQGQALYDQVAGLSSPQYLASNATALGMVVGGSPTYIKLSDGKIIGAADVTYMSSIAAAKSAVPNSLIANTPLVTEPDKTITGNTAKEAPAGSTAAGAAPPAITEGLPSPQTH
ncbi:hypothetical protein [Microbacterium gorillae]|uniref:hypothetical protein n=1 Tax=Microbacterium gorillae TaxID=1231063 RepID=UPI000694D138|nr:hypothetical protein [Microbacterium gorillae]